MKEIEMLNKVIEEAKSAVSNIPNGFDKSSLSCTVNKEWAFDSFFFCDNMDAMSFLLDEGYERKLDLIYIDPPFFTKDNYKRNIKLTANGQKLTLKTIAYDDKWESLYDYLLFMTKRLFLMHRLLSERGSLYIHIDYRTSHYFRLILDEIFGKERFLNEIIWAYKSGGTGRRSYSRKHDNILVYTKTSKYIFNPLKEKSYNRGLAQYRFKGVKEYKDEKGWYTLVNLKDVWSIDMVGRTSSERTGYETQKPLKLLNRIIEVSTNEDSIVADFFLGSGTTAEAAIKLNRRFIGSDSSTISQSTVLQRIFDISRGFRLFSYKQNPNDERLDIRFSTKRGEDFIVIKIDRYIPKADYIREIIASGFNPSEIIVDNYLLFIEQISIIKTEETREITEVFFRPDIPGEIFIKSDNLDDSNFEIEIIDVFGNKDSYKLSSLE